MKAVIIVAIMAMLGGCATHTVHAVAEKQIQVPVTIPAELLVHCSVTEPIAARDYLALDLKARENALTDYAIRLIGDIKLCNQHLDTIKDYQDKIVKTVDAANKDAK